jgi:hypothetical protein
MANKYGIRAEVERQIRLRDKVCVYCGKKMKKGHPKDGPTIEHLNNIPHDYYPSELTEWDVAICCHSCNTSRGAKHYWDWLKSPYCIKKNINKKTVADVVKKYMAKYPTVRKFK